MTSLSAPSPVHLLGIPIHPVSAPELIDLLIDWGRGGPLRRVFNVNVHAMNLARDDAAFAAALAGADLVFCDGFGVKWAARLHGIDLPHRLTPPDWIDAFAAATAASGQTVFALGDEPGVAAQFQQKLAASHPGYRAAGSHHGFFKDDAELVDQINKSGATHLLVGMGMPRQELWITAAAPRLRVKTAVTVGALYRWHIGLDRRAPRWMTDHGLEWLARLATSPVRHFGRYAIGNPRFVLRVIVDRWSQK